MTVDLNQSNFMMYAIKCYDGKNYSMIEFNEDIKIIRYVKRLIKRYNVSGELKERLILNHIITLSNVFGVVPTVRMLFYKINKSDYPTLKTFLLSLNYMPDIILGIDGKNILSSDIMVNMEVASRLRKL